MKKTKVLQRSFGVMYLGTCFINLYLGITQPEILKSLADTALIQPYKFFAANAHISILRLSLIMFFVYQLCLSMLLISHKGWLNKLGVIGGFVFHIGILPWGLWSWPNLLFVIAYIMLFKNKAQDSLVTKDNSSFEV